jgi:endonuclease-3
MMHMRHAGASRRGASANAQRHSRSLQCFLKSRRTPELPLRSNVRASVERQPRSNRGERVHAMNPAKRRAIYETLRALNPNPTTELLYTTPFELLVAVVLSAQATDKGVNTATRVLFKVANTPRAMVELGEERLASYIHSTGFYRAKARNVIRLSQALLDQHGGEVPRDREALEALPGVGRKTANVLLNTVFGEPTIAVDTHVFRVANRTNLAPGSDPEEVEHRLMKFTPDEFKPNAHHWLILHGRYICKARVPECWRCPIVKWCEYRHKTPAPVQQAA